ncbi:MAG: CoA pyrophosphatase [Gammaproteobacteria bacterium]|nr:CoA pyrophosphatase [Gammaproteobacteria bacterium]
MPHDAALHERTRGNLSAFERLPCESTGLVPAAVAFVIARDAAGEAGFILTRRAPKLREHGGQWALPGGRVDAGETVVEAALRELDEEVGINLHPDRVLGVLDDYPTRSGFVITPVVVWGDDSPMRPAPQEVAAAYHVPLARLMADDVVGSYQIPESERPVLTVSLLGDKVHAPTAAVVYQAREVAIAGRSTRVVDFEQPVFAWR